MKHIYTFLVLFSLTIPSSANELGDGVYYCVPDQHFKFQDRYSQQVKNIKTERFTFKKKANKIYFGAGFPTHNAEIYITHNWPVELSNGFKVGRVVASSKRGLNFVTGMVITGEKFVVNKISHIEIDRDGTIYTNSETITGECTKF
jgi:hypothetical protein